MSTMTAEQNQFMPRAELIHQFKILLIVSAITLVGQRIGTGADIIPAVPGIMIITAIIMLALYLKDAFKQLKLPAFAWCTLIAFLLSTPWSPISESFLGYTNKIGFLATTTPILALAGVSVGDKIDVLKKLSWKMVVVAMVVFTSTFFGSAVISQIILKFQGLI